MNKFASMRVGLAKQNADEARGLLYGTGMNLAETNDPNPKAKKTGMQVLRKGRSCNYKVKKL